jgi:SSS family solute:Na+ symporter
MAILFQRLLNWPFSASVVASAVVVAIYIYLGGLTSSIYNEVLQFFLIVFGFLPLAILGLKAVGGFAGLETKLAQLPYPGYGHTWANIWHSNMNPMGVNWIGTIFGLGFVLSFGYWCTDFLVVQRGLAAKDMPSAQRTPLIAAIPKMFFPLLIILPGLVAISYGPIRQLLWDPAKGDYNYNQALPAMLASLYPSGLLGIGLTALLASFMSGMAGNVTAFNTVWTFDIYQTHLNPGREDSHYLRMGKFATIFAVAVGIGTAFIVLMFNNLMDYLQLLFAFFNAPLFATFLLGMFSKRATPTGGFWGLLTGILAAAAHYTLLHFHVFRYPNAQAMANNFYQAMWAFGVCFVVTLVVSSFTAPKKEDELVGLVYQVTPKPSTEHLPWYERPGILAVGILALCAVLNIIFW